MAAVRAFQAFLGVFFGTPIGRKTVMALTGAGAAAFLLVHLAGNLVVFKGPGAFGRYAAGLHGFPFLPVLEVGLGLLLIAHVSLGVLLFVQNLLARPTGYASHASAGAKTLASTTMIYTGLATLAFILFHLWTVKFGPGTDRPVYERVERLLRDPLVATAYAAGVVAVGLHLSHGASSALLTLGLRHPLHDPWVDLLGRIGAALMAVGFASVVVWFVVLGAPQP
jgi:succinate dehydrogenase / fumarate reductase, cytochrome b subunit